MDALLAVKKLMDDYFLLMEENKSLKEEVLAMKMLLSPPAIPPIAETPVRQVTGVELPEERE